MADTKISGLTEDTAPTGGNYFVEVDDTGGTPTTKRINGHRFVEMGERNYKIVVSIAAGNITVALKNLAGNDFSATDPLVVKIGNAWQTVTGALSVTVNAGANSFNAGSAELATKFIDYFVYLGYRTASTAVVIGFSRIPWGSLYSDFSATTTNEQYGAFSTAPASTDDVVNIGRIRATLSAGAGYTWTSVSQSAPDGKNTKQYPFFETALSSWVPVFTNLSVGNGILTARYIINTQGALEYHVELVFGSTISSRSTKTMRLIFGGWVSGLFIFSSYLTKYLTRS